MTLKEAVQTAHSLCTIEYCGMYQAVSDIDFYQDSDTNENVVCIHYDAESG